jgi:hypothetical protein
MQAKERIEKTATLREPVAAVPGRRMAKFLDFPDRWNRRESGMAEAGAVLGISARLFRRCRDRLEEERLEVAALALIAAAMGCAAVFGA